MARFGTFFHGALSRQERACLTSFVRLGHEVSLFAYQPVNLPAGVIPRDAAEILPRSALYVAEGGPHGGTVGQFSDHFRYCMVRATGLTWIDTDIVCLKADWPDAEFLIAPQDQCLVNGAVLGCPRDHPMLDQAIAVSERMAGLTLWGIIGPHLLTALAWEHRFRHRLLPVDAFYPLHVSKAPDLLRPLKPGEQLSIPGEALCIHLWNEMLRMHGHDRHAAPPAGSALAGLLAFAEGPPDGAAAAAMLGARA